MFTRVSTWKGFQQSFSPFIVDVISAAEIALCRFSLFHKDFRFGLPLKDVLYSIASQSIVFFIISSDFLSFFSSTRINILAFFFLIFFILILFSNSSIVFEIFCLFFKRKFLFQILTRLLRKFIEFF